MLKVFFFYNKTRNKEEAIKLRKDCENLYKNFTESANYANSLIEKSEKMYTDLMESMEQIEESRSAFTKTLLAKHLKFTEEIASAYKSKIDSMNSAISKIDGGNDLRLFLGEILDSKQTTFVPIEMVNFPIKESETDLMGSEQELGGETDSTKSIGDLLEDYFARPAPVSLASHKEEAKISFEEAFINLQDGKNLTLEQKVTIIEKLNTPTGRQTFCQLLSQLTNNLIIVTENSYQSVLEFCNHLLTEFVTNRDNNYDILQTILIASRKILADFGDRKEFMYQQLVKHGIWQEMDVWKILIDSSIKYKITQAKEIRARQKKRDQSKIPEKPVSFANLFGKVKDVVAFGVAKILPQTSAEAEFEASDDFEILVSRAALNVLNIYSYYLSTPYIKLERVLRLYRNYVKEYNIPDDKMVELELELRRCQNTPINNGRKKETHLKKFIAKCKKYGKKGPYILSMCVKFIGDKQTLRNLLILSKLVYEKIKIPVFRQVLMGLNIKISIQARVKIWSQILDVVFFY